MEKKTDISFLSFMTIVGGVVAVLIFVVTALTYLPESPEQTFTCYRTNFEHGMCQSTQPTEKKP